MRPKDERDATNLKSEIGLEFIKQYSLYTYKKVVL